ncbi:MAG: ABC transporter ATP-binding protein [Gemmataceae bacterium]
MFTSDQLPVLSASNLSHAFGSGNAITPVLDNVSVEFRAGEVGLLMGPSGSGKSTLLSILSGLQRPRAGTVHILGEDIWLLNDAERERFRLENFGFIFQGFNLFPALSAYQQLELVLRWGLGMSRREARPRVEAMLDRLGLASRAKLRPDQLSGGEKQRVAIGRALIKKPRLCFADEPTSALDWRHGQQAMQMLQDTAREVGATVLVVTHDPRLIPFATQQYHLADGRLTAQSPRHDATEHTSTTPASSHAIAHV